MLAIVQFVSERGEWVALVLDEDEMIDVGCELTEIAACDWAAAAIEYHSGESNKHPSDMYDRASVATH